MLRKKRLLVVEPVINPPGGAQCVAAWALQALRDEYTVDLITWTPVDFEEINRFYGTKLIPGDHKAWSAPAWLRKIISLDPDIWSIQRIAILMRLVKLSRRNYELIASFCDEIEFGAPAIQYIHFPYMGRIYRKEQGLRKTNGVQGRIRAAIYMHRPWRLISGFSFERVKANFTLVNSKWTGRQFLREYGIEPAVLYPPVPGDFPSVPWEERENGFVCIGRISGEKRYERIISILAAVRARGFAVHLHIIGQLQPHAAGVIYYQSVANLVRQHSDWVTLEENITRTELGRLVAQHRYGIHGMLDEHFGIAVAEMVRGGCVVFVPNGGGQVEIVGENDQLCYATESEGVEKIANVMNDANMQYDLQVKLAERAKQFVPERFCENLRNIVAGLVGN
jgi:glycosyltransferase involved in cell wall biosynthesis